MSPVDQYANYQELQCHEKKDKDYTIIVRQGTSGVAVMAPHGGGIEPGTSEIADTVAGTDHTFYTFKGIKPRGNGALHITSTRFDEPDALKVLRVSNKILVIHGCAEKEKVVFIGGQDLLLRQKIRSALCEAHFLVKEHPFLKGRDQCNLCNRNSGGMGVQLEISAGLRRSMFQVLHTSEGRKEATEVFTSFVRALRKALC